MTLDRPFRASVRLALALVLSVVLAVAAVAQPTEWRRDWPCTDFSRASVNFSDIQAGGPARDGIPAIDNPLFRPASDETELTATEPVISLVIGTEAQAYPLRVLIWHEIVNDVIGGIPVAVTYCPLCNSGLAFDRRVDGRVLDFAVSGKLRHSDMIMFDRQTESWWQQFMGDAIVGQMTGATLERVAVTTIPLGEFKRHYPGGVVLVPSDRTMRAYGDNPYSRYDGGAWPALYQGDYAGPVPPLAYVVSVGKDAWPLDMIRRAGRLEHGDIVITWQPGMNSALDARRIAEGRDIGFVAVHRRAADGKSHPAIHEMTFAFAFMAFHPDGRIHAAPKATRE